MEGLVWETKKKRAAIIDPRGDKVMDKDGSVMGRKRQSRLMLCK